LGKHVKGGGVVVRRVPELIYRRNRKLNSQEKRG